VKIQQILKKSNIENCVTLKHIVFGFEYTYKYAPTSTHIHLCIYTHTSIHIHTYICMNVTSILNKNILLLKKNPNLQHEPYCLKQGVDSRDTDNEGGDEYFPFYLVLLSSVTYKICIRPDNG
jgi:hypothetical protein